MAALGDLFRRIRRQPAAGNNPADPDAAANPELVASPETSANPGAVTSPEMAANPTTGANLQPRPAPSPGNPADTTPTSFPPPDSVAPQPTPLPPSPPLSTPDSFTGTGPTVFNPPPAARPPGPIPAPPAASMFPDAEPPPNTVPAGPAEPVAPEPSPPPLPTPQPAAGPTTTFLPPTAAYPSQPPPAPPAASMFPDADPLPNAATAGSAEPAAPEPLPPPLPTPQPAAGSTTFLPPPVARPSQPPPAPPPSNMFPDADPPSNTVPAGPAESAAPEPLPPPLPTPQPAAGLPTFLPPPVARPSQPPPAPPAADLIRPPEPTASAVAPEPLPPPMPSTRPPEPPPVPPANAAAAQPPPPLPSANYMEPTAAAPTPPPPAPTTAGLFGPPPNPPAPPRPAADFAAPDDEPRARIAVADAETDAAAPAGAIIDDAPADPMMLNCPYCGASENRVGSRCNRCGRVIVRLPPWAQHRRQNWFLRRLSMRRIVAACVIVLFILFVVWINYPFAPNPIVLSRNIHTQITIDEGPGAWSVIGRDLRHSRNVSVGPPPPEGRLDWQTYIPSPLNSEPVVQRANIYVGSADGVYPLSDFNGQTRENWEGKTPGRVTGAVAVADSYLFFGSTDHTVNAWDAHTGDVRWSFPAEDTVKVSPVVANGLVYISSGKGWLYALDVQNGSVIWRERLDGNASAAAAVHEGKLFVGDEKGIFYIRSARTGQEHFRYRTPRTISGSPVVTSDGARAYFASGGQIYAVDAASREIPGLYQFKQVWAQLWLWQVPGVPRPQGQQGGLWRFTPDNPLQGILSSPALAEDADSNRQILYAGAHDHKLYALDATYEDIDNRLLWTFEAKEAIWASPLVVKDRVIFGDDAGNVYSLNRITGEPEWTLNLRSPVRIAPIISGGGLLIIRTLNGNIHGIK